MTTNELNEQPPDYQSNELEDDFIDETLLVAMTNEYRPFCLQIENLMIQFIKSPKFII